MRYWIAEAIHIQTKSLEQTRDELKAKRNTLFEKYLKHPHDTRLAVEIKTIDEQVAECNEEIVKTGRRF